MDLAALISQYRSDAKDRVSPYLATRADVVMWLNEAQNEACMRKRLLRLADNATYCDIAVTAGTASYSLNAVWAWVDRVDWLQDGETEPVKLPICTVAFLDRYRPTWRTAVTQPEFVIITDHQLQLGCIPETAGDLTLEGYRLPTVPIEDAADESPEIHVSHHRHLVKWLLFRAFSRPDSQLYNPDGAAKAMAEFDAYFGLPVDADRRRDQVQDMPQVNECYF